ncbi:hypothetical protein RI129_004649 [Pyrocoelia pectoralis]|uniref:Uncharacterized protein n=1 Tax=Pyrocoelia pectoralis TaxID=417401 RepID=A0AAN7VD98_9COLE
MDEFPINKGKRRFSPSHYMKVLSNGEVVERSWLIYSVTNDGVFCFCCIFLIIRLLLMTDPKEAILTGEIAANENVNNLQCSTEYPVEIEVRARRKKCQFEYEAVDEPLTEENKLFKLYSGPIHTSGNP